MSATLQRTPEVHVRYDGASHDFSQNDLDVGDVSTNVQIKAAVANRLNVPVEKLDNFVVDRNTDTGDITLRPQAVFGSK